MQHQTVYVVDFGGQYTQLIVRRVREFGVYSEMVPWTCAAEKIREGKPSAVILSGGPKSVLDPGAPDLDFSVLEGLPVLGICYGQQLMAARLGGRVEKAGHKEYGLREIRSTGVSPVSPRTVSVLEGPFLDPEAPLEKRQGAYLPHWTQEGAIYHVVFRLKDSVPSEVLQEWRIERERLETMRASDLVSTKEGFEYLRLHQEKIDAYLDAGHGECLLRDERAASCVVDALGYFNGERYTLHAWCVMPNHVHVVVQPAPGHSLDQITHSWKSFTSHEINKLLGRSGGLWQEESYDHLIRDASDYLSQVKYVLENPKRAKLVGWKWVSAPEVEAEDSQPDRDGPATHGRDARAMLVSDLASNRVWMSHGDQVMEVPPGFTVTATTDSCPIAAFENPATRQYGVQFHPEVTHTPDGKTILRRFLFDVANLRGDWTSESFIEEQVEAIRAMVGDGKVLCAVSGGVDSSVMAALLIRAIGDRAVCVFVDHGLLRKGEAEQVVETFRGHFHANLKAFDERDRFFSALAGEKEPERKRKIIGENFVRVFEDHANELSGCDFLAQGTLYPDVIESGSPTAAKIKTHHNVGGLPDWMRMKLIEPLRWLFKDEVRA
ncbi:MAG TPA: transposase, partial [Fimbriimonas sp.]